MLHAQLYGWMSKMDNLFLLPLADVFNLKTLHNTHKEILYAMLYGSVIAPQAIIDDEGCGAVFAEARLIAW